MDFSLLKILEEKKQTTDIYKISPPSSNDNL